MRSLTRLLPTLLLLTSGAAAGVVTAPVHAAPGPTAYTRTVPPQLRDAHGVHVVSVASADDRLVRIVVSTKALERPVRVNVLLPESYAATEGEGRRYPSFYLFHGTSGGAEDWLTNGEVREATTGRDLVTVMPDAGYDSNGGSWFTDWVDQETELGAARWETFHTRQLVPWVDANFRTVRDRSGRAVAGLSQGGFGSFTYAARHPDLFVAAASFSGAPDIARNPVAKEGATAVISATMTGLNGVQPFAPFGDPNTQDIVWQGHNPATLVTNLRDTDLQLWCGNGDPGPLDDPAQPNPGASGVERFVHQSTTFFAGYAEAAGVDHVFHDYGAGTHTWPYWARDLREWLPHLEAVLAERRAAPAVVSYRSIEKTWREWGWKVASRRDAPYAWSGLREASVEGFTLTGGRALVRTPAEYRPGRAYRLRYDGGSGPERVVADERGRLRTVVRQDADGGPVTVRVRAVAAAGPARTR